MLTIVENLTDSNILNSRYQILNFDIFNSFTNIGND